MNNVLKLIVFDLDNTLAESKNPIKAPIPKLLSRLTERWPVAIISGGALPQFLTQVVQHLPPSTDLHKFYILPTSGAALYVYKGEWKKLYEELLKENEVREIEAAMKSAATETGLIDFSKPAYGERIELRGGQVSLSALGQKAPYFLKKEWDPDKKKRYQLRDAIAERLPEFSVGIGGSTTIDVTKKDVDKAYGLHQLCRFLNVEESSALYVGDELESGGNDEAIFKTAAQTHPVHSVAETAEYIQSLLDLPQGS